MTVVLNKTILTRVDDTLIFVKRRGVLGNKLGSPIVDHHILLDESSSTYSFHEPIKIPPILSSIFLDKEFPD